MKLAIMQPYFFPYLGYFQLIHAVDTFVVYDDAMFIKQGWINRNFLLMDCRPQRFTISLSHVSSFQLICNTKISGGHWRVKFLKSLRQAYSKAPNIAQVYALVESVVIQKYPSIAEVALESLNAVMDYLGLTTVVRTTSRIYDNASLKGQDRILDICKQEQADVYINLPGGRALYDQEVFAGHGMDLRFLQPNEVRYPQFCCEFVPNLSILDVLMFNDRRKVREMLQAYSLDYCP